MKRWRLHRIIFLSLLLKILLPPAIESQRITRPPSRHLIKPALLSQGSVQMLRWNLTLANRPVLSQTSNIPQINQKENASSQSNSSQESLLKNYPAVLYVPDSTTASSSTVNKTRGRNSGKSQQPTILQKTAVPFSRKKVVFATTLAPGSVLNTTIRAIAKAELIIRPNFMSKGKSWSSEAGMEVKASDDSAIFQQPVLPASPLADEIPYSPLPVQLPEVVTSYGGTDPILTKIQRYYYSPPVAVGPYLAPPATSGPYFAYVRENANIGAHVITVKTEASTQAMLTYQIVRGNQRGHFHIDSTGSITVAAPLDREVVDGYNLSVRAFDYSGHDCISPVFIAVVDVNDHAPVISNTAGNGASFLAPCGVANAYVGTIHATDADIGRNGQVYFCLDQDHSNLGLFYIDPLSGTIATLTELPPQPDQYLLRVTAKDQAVDGQLRTEIEVAVNVQCQARQIARPPPPVRAPPVCRTGPTEGPPMTVTVSSGTPVGETVATVSATGTDGQAVVFFLPPGNPQSSVFVADPTSGQIRIKTPLSEPIYQLHWEARDNYGLACSGLLVVQVVPVNIPPQFSAPMYQFVVTQCGQPGIILGTVHAADPNTGILGQVSYSSSDENIDVDSKNGLLRLKNAVRPSLPAYIFQVMAMDGGNLYSIVNVTMTIQCSTPTPPLPPPTVQFTEAAYLFSTQCGIANAQVGQVLALSSRNDPLIYSILPNPAFFTINPRTGVVSTSLPLPSTQTVYALIIRASTSGAGPAVTGQVSVTINVACRIPSTPEPAPIPVIVAGPQCPLEPIEAVLSSTAPVGAIVASVGVSSRPPGNPPIQFSIPEMAFPIFQIDPQSGVIRLKSPPDRNFVANGGATMQVRATDVTTGLFCSIPVRIQVIKGNRPPVFSNSSYIFEVGCVGRTDIAGYVRASDMDSGADGEINYYLDGLDSAFFKLDQRGDIRPAAELSRSTYSMLVTARDGGGASSQAAVVINHRCAAAVQCPPSPVAFALNENAPVGSRVGPVYAIGSGVSYRIVSPGADAIFAVEASTGLISIKQSMQAIQSTPVPSANRTANFIIRATDGRNHFCDISVFLTVNFTLNTPPAFTNSSFTFFVGCGFPEMLVGIVQARETRPRNVPSYLVYDITGMDSVPMTGELRLRLAALNRATYYLTAGVTDSGGLRDQASVTVVANCPPLDCPSSVTLQIPEDLPVGNVLGQIPPVGNPRNGAVGYRLVVASSIINVVISPQSGVITLAQPIPSAAAVAPPGLLSLVVAAFGSSGQNCNITIRVSITKRNRPPEFVGMPYVFTLVCNQLSNVVGRVTAVFAGSFQPAAVAYSITQGNRQILVIDEISGEIRIVGNASQGRLPLQVTARDLNGLIAHAPVEVIIPTCPLDCPAVLRAQVREDSPRGVGITFVTTSSALAGSVTYRFSEDFFASEFGGLFSIDPRSGAVTLNNMVEGRGGQVLRVPVMATSSSGQTCQIILEIGIVRRSPPSLICPRLTGVEVRQDADPGTVLTRVSVGEPGDFLFSLTEMSGAGGFFEIDRMSGLLRVSSLLYSLPPRTYTLAIRASLQQDVTQFCDTAVAVTVLLVNSTLQCPSMPLVATVDASSAVYDTVAIVRVGSPNGYPLTFTLGESYPSIVTVNQSNGAVTLNRGFLNATRPQYQFVIRAADYYGAFCDTTLLLNIPPVNRPPVFSSTQYQFTTTCGPQNSFIGVVGATDMDNDRLTFEISPAEFFIIDQLGAIRTRVPILTVIPRQILTAVVADPSGLSATAQVTIIFNGIGCGSPPVCSQPVYRFDLPAYSPVGTAVGRVSAIDPDGDRLSYLIFGPDQYKFGVDPTTGDIRLLQAEGQANQTAYQFPVRASSAANAFCEMTVQVTIRSPDGPQFQRPSYTFDVQCGSGWTRCLGSVTANSQTGTVKYSVPNNAILTVGQTTGEICLGNGTTNSQMSQSVVVTAVDNLSGATATATTTVTLNFQACHRPPVCASAALNSAVNEVDPVGTRVQQVSASDPDIGDTLTFAITSGNQENMFTINAQDGIVRINRVLDRESVNSYKLSITIKDSTGLTCQIMLNVAIIDNNDNVPVFVRTPYALTVPCQKAMAFVGSVMAVDADVGMNARVSYSTAPNGPITVDAETGEIRTRVPLDATPNGPYLVSIFASDSGSPQRTATTSVTIRVICAATAGPICPPPSSLQVRENSPANTVVTQVTSQDPQGQPLQYFLSGVGSDRFEVTSGGKIILVKNLDRESSLNPFSLSVQVQNAAGQTCTTLLTITILDKNDQIPSFVIRETNFSVDCGLQGATAGVVSAIDGDVGQNALLEYSVLGTTDFAVDRQTGEIHTLRPLESQPPVREVTLTVNDRGTPRRTAQTVVRINVRQNCPSAQVLVLPPLQCRDTYTVRIRDDANIAAEVATISAPTFLAAATAGAPEATFAIVQGNEQGLLQINRQTGRLTVAKSLLPGSLSLVVSSSIGTQSCTSRVSVTIADENDNSPQFQQPSYSFTTTCGNVGVIGRTTATDSDQGLNGVIYFTLSGSLNFMINTRSGEIFAPAPLAATAATYQLRVTATDSGQPARSATATVTVNVQCWQNSIATTVATTMSYLWPICPDPLVMDVEENIVGLVIGTVQGRDPNAGGVLRYTLLPTADSAFFQVDTVANAGRLSLVSPLDRETQATFIVDVRVLNNYGLSCETPVRVNVIDVNDNQPIFSQNAYQFQVDCSGQAPFSVGGVTAKDADVALNGVVLYSAPADQPFTVNPSTGIISLSNLLPTPASGIRTGTLTSQINAANPIPPRRNSTTTIQVTLSPSCFMQIPAPAALAPLTQRSSNQPPQCQGLRGPSNAVEMDENSQIGMFVGVFEASDADVNDSLNFRVSSGDPDRHFLVDSATGELRVNGRLDRETKDFYNLTLSAVDPTGSSCSRPVFVRITDRNDNAPEVLNMLPLVASVNCSVANAWVVQISAADRDLGQNAILGFSLDATSGFQISPKGEVRTTDGLPRDPPARFVAIVISDHGSASLSTTVTLTVNVLCPVAGSPIFDQQYYCAGIKENSLANTEITRVTARYPDNRTDVSYVLRSGNSELFSVDHQSGVIRSRVPLDAETLAGDNSLVVGTLQNDKSTPDAYTVVFVNILDENDRSPKFEEEYRAVVPVATPVNSALLRVRALDADKTFPNNHIRGYEIDVEVGLQPYLRIDGSGELVLSRPLTTLQGKFIPVTVIAVDGGNPPRTGMTIVQLSVV